MSRLQKLLGVGKGYLERLPPVDVHKLLRIILLNLPYIMIFYVGNKLAWLYQYCAGNSMIERLMVLILNFQLAFSRILPSMHKNELLVGLTGAVGVKLMVYLKGKNAKKFRQGVEYGSARWGTAKDIAPFIDPIFENNILLTMTERLTMNGRPKNPKFARNKNVIVIGGSGSGKTRFYVKPNLMQMGKYISYVVTDPKGTIIIECGKMLVRHGYKVKVLNTINFSKSTAINIDTMITTMETAMESMEIGELVILALETMLVSLCMKVISVFITVILYGRMIEIYLYSSVGAIPFATMSNREWGQIGNNYLRGLFALAFQGFFMMVCVGIYAVLVANIQMSDNIHSALFGVMAYTVILCFSLMKTGNFARSIFNAH